MYTSNTKFHPYLSSGLVGEMYGGTDTTFPSGIHFMYVLQRTHKNVRLQKSKIREKGK